MNKFKLAERTVVLTFESEPDWSGLEVTCRARASLADALYFQKQVSGADLEAYAGAVRRFGDELLLGWNLFTGDTDEPLPANGESLLSLPDARLASAIIARWAESVSGVPGPLGAPSRDGGGSAEESTKRETSS